jgi:preprotein translocase subunit SecB
MASQILELSHTNGLFPLSLEIMSNIDNQGKFATHCLSDIEFAFTHINLK